MKRELKIFFTALMFYTRIPCPAWVDHDETYLNLSTRYLPVIGWLVGAVYGGVILAASFVFPPVVSILLGWAATILLTGAFHEDGFADVCDGFGGGWTKERILAIMKDSRVGTYGVVGLVLLFALKLAATYEIWTASTRTSFFLLMVTAHSFSRLMPIAVIFLSRYAREENDSSKAKPVATAISYSQLITAGIFAMTPLAVLVARSGLIVLLVVVPMVAITLYLNRYFKKWIGGYTGDCLGAVQQVNEVVFLLVTLALWKYT